MSVSNAPEIQLYSAPRTRALRVVWLLKELELDYQLIPVEFKTTVGEFFIQDTPTGKIPTLAHGETLICESGAITEYLLEQASPAASATLAPPPGHADRGRFLQWLHFAESTAWGPIGVVVWLTVYRADAADHPPLIQDAQARVQNTLNFVETELGGGPWVLGASFSAADIMLGFTILVAEGLDLLTPEHPNLRAYLQQIRARPGFQQAAREVGGFGS